MADALNEVVGYMRSALPAPPARVLEVGAGHGELAAALSEAGYDVLAIDPAGHVPSVARVALLDVDEPSQSFDAAIAVLSLHHVEPLAESCRRLAELLPPGAPLVIDEFDVERFDGRAARWWLEHRGGEHGDHDAMVAELRDHLHPVARLRTELAPWFSLGEPVRGPYLYRWDLPPGLREAEEELIATGALAATGARLTGPRQS